MTSEFIQGILYGSCCTMVVLTIIVHIAIYYERRCHRNEYETFRLVIDYDVMHDPKRILDDNNQFVCIVCLEAITDPNIPVIECLSCHHYISHVRCFDQWHRIEPRCMYCRQ